MLSRKHYKAVAEILSHYPEGDISPLEVMVIQFADMFAQDNPRFDRGLFYEACGVGA
tara:strand:- start:2251 stop:2421 length:171 start_codon:yes stop_codon:yes gene_type:complete